MKFKFGARYGCLVLNGLNKRYFLIRLTMFHYLAIFSFKTFLTHAFRNKKIIGKTNATIFASLGCTRILLI